MNNYILRIKSTIFALVVLLLAQDCFAQEKNASPVKAGEVVSRFSKDADSAKLIVKNAWVAEWMDTVSKLPKIEPRTVVYNNKDLIVDEELYYSGRHGSPLAYARLLDLAVSAGFKANENSRVFDFGYGSIGHLSMLALSGHDCFLSSIASMLKPNGLFVIYNLCPAKAPTDMPYVPWAEGESPFSRQSLERTGFQILQFDTNDDVEARRLGRALKWDQGGGMNLESDLFAWVTIVRKRSETEGGKP